MHTFSVLLVIFCVLSDILGFNCTEGAELCQVCKTLGGTDGVNTFFTSGQCSVYTKITEEDKEYSEAEICELLFTDYSTSCQMAVISDVDLLGYYIQYGIRAIGHSMLLSLSRDNCTATWNWWSRLANETKMAGLGDENEDCDVVQGGFVDYALVRFNPSNFTPTGVLCQCGEKVSFLPTVAPRLSYAIFDIKLILLVVLINL